METTMSMEAYRDGWAAAVAGSLWAGKVTGRDRAWIMAEAWAVDMPLAGLQQMLRATVALWTGTWKSDRVRATDGLHGVVVCADRLDVYDLGGRLVDRVDLDSPLVLETPEAQALMAGVHLWLWASRHPEGVPVTAESWERMVVKKGLALPPGDRVMPRCAVTVGDVRRVQVMAPVVAGGIR